VGNSDAVTPDRWDPNLITPTHVAWRTGVQKEFVGEERFSFDKMCGLSVTHSIGSAETYPPWGGMQRRLAGILKTQFSSLSRLRMAEYIAAIFSIFEGGCPCGYVDDFSGQH